MSRGGERNSGLRGFLQALTQRRVAIAEGLRSRLWPTPALGVVMAIAVGLALPEVDSAVDPHMPPALTSYIFGGGADAARELLSAIATSLVTVTSLTFSLTLITLQLASSQYTPRLLRTFAADHFVQRTLAVFLATFAYALTVLRSVRNKRGEGAEFVPQIAVTLSYLLAMVSVLALVLFLGHLVRQIRIEMMLGHVSAEATATAHRVLDPLDDDEPDDRIPSPPTAHSMIVTQASGFLVEVDERAVLAAAVDADAVVWLDRQVGSSLIAGVPAAFCWSADPSCPLDAERLASLRKRVCAAMRTGMERTSTQDISYGLRQLTDVVIRALSPGINDPTTAVHGLSSCAAVLCDLVNYRLGHRVLRDDDGAPRVVVAAPDLAALLDVVCTQVQQYGSRDPVVLARLLSLLRELAWTARLPVHRRAVAGRLVRVQQAIAEQGFDASVSAQLDALAGEVRAAMDRRWSPAIGTST
ncbi:hypothetical protein NJB18091_26000 [Mycobacterium marinum]|uniref:DUF2254 domain-containing protein n=1 Tax=Mycobacterium marinum TaxID=1781 RepID=UPI0021C2E8C1|nr:DUF2254 domain-containing protein [Mycobacterium marinum]GJN97824.1 hypothetical protein NJB18091_26000 [Mycobacterium marinum]